MHQPFIHFETQLLQIMAEAEDPPSFYWLHEETTFTSWECVERTIIQHNAKYSTKYVCAFTNAWSDTKKSKRKLEDMEGQPPNRYESKQYNCRHVGCNARVKFEYVVVDKMLFLRKFTLLIICRDISYPNACLETAPVNPYKGKIVTRHIHSNKDSNKEVKQNCSDNTNFECLDTGSDCEVVEPPQEHITVTAFADALQKLHQYDGDNDLEVYTFTSEITGCRIVLYLSMYRRLAANTWLNDTVN
jgi:hypothetical protein